MFIKKDVEVHIAHVIDSGWFISAKVDYAAYLHEDLTWHNIMKSQDGIWQYTKTKEQAQERLNKWRNL